MTDGDRWRRATIFVAVSVLAGLMVAGLFLPVVGALGVGAKSAALTFDSLPGEFIDPPPPQSTEVLARDGSVVAQFFTEDRTLTRLAAVPQVTRQAVISIEDSRFYEHNGLDLRGIVRALLKDTGAGGAAQGGSTLEQQYVKNVLVESARTPAERDAATADTIARKIREARYAAALARKLTKDQILERYLNIVYFGEGAYGITSAARRYFGLPVQRLDLAQSALLAGLIRSPSYYDPAHYAQRATDRRNVVLARMLQLHHITEAQARAAVKEPLRIRLTPAPNGCMQSWAPFYCDWVQHLLITDPALGRDEATRAAALLRGGLVVRTALDPKMQRAAQHAVDRIVPNGGRVASAVVLVNPSDGGVRAMAVNRGYGHGAGQTMVNYAVGGKTGFQAGSTFKVFVLARALQMGIPLNMTLSAPQTYTSHVFDNYVNGRVEPYTVKNAGDSEAGTFTLEQATWDSVNTFYIQVEERTGVGGPAHLAESMGVHRYLDQPLARVGGLFLGVNEVTPLDMAEAYATFANHGVHCDPLTISEIDSANRPISTTKPRCAPVLDARVADTVTSVLRGVIDGPDPRRTGINASIGRPAAGKTGTTENFGAAWFCGFTPNLAGVVWVGDPRGAAYPLRNVAVGGQVWPQIYGGDLPARTWAAAMSGALAGTPPIDFSGSPLDISAAKPQAPGPAPARQPGPGPAPAPSPAPHKKHGH